MNTEIKAKWVGALRSGEYKQGRDYLHRDDGSMCCLGVLCEIHKKENNQKWNLSEKEHCFYYLDRETLPPKEVADWADLPMLENGPIVQIGDRKSAIAILNDDGVTFEELADAIEEQL